MSVVILTEKSNQAEAVANMLGSATPEHGYFTAGRYIATWCIGHMLELSEPQDYDPSLKAWSLTSLPIRPVVFACKPVVSKLKQLNVLKRLLRNANEIIIATDAGREGELIAREVIEHVGYRGPIKRLWAGSLDDAGLRKAFANLLPGDAKLNLYYSALARRNCDWLVGMNLTRLYTLCLIDPAVSGTKLLLSIGRIQTPLLRLIVDRDNLIDAFTPKPHYSVSIDLSSEGMPVALRWIPSEDVTDSAGHCINVSTARNLAQNAQDAIATVVSVETKRKSMAQPTPYKLSSLEGEANRRWGYSLKKTAGLAQSLYEKHKATTYPRTDSSHIPLTQWDERKAVLQCIAKTDPNMKHLCDIADLDIRSPSWWSDQQCANQEHHGIIPRMDEFDLQALSSDEYNIYDLIRRRYLAQFYPAYEYDSVRVVVSAASAIFECRAISVISPGWKHAYDELSNDNDAVAAAPVQSILALARGEQFPVSQATMLELMTQPPQHYTEGEIGDEGGVMENVAKYVTDSKAKTTLRETSGLGTSATRPDIIETIVQRRYVMRKGKQLISTELGRAIISVLPSAVSDPVTTAQWEDALKAIAEGRFTMQAFMEQQTQWVTQIVNSAKRQFEADSTSMRQAFAALANINAAGASAANNSKGAKRVRKTSKTRKRASGKQFNINAAKMYNGLSCPTCQSGKIIDRVVKTGNNAGKHFWGCTNTKCNFFSWPANGQSKSSASAS